MKMRLATIPDCQHLSAIATPAMAQFGSLLGGSSNSSSSVTLKPSFPAFAAEKLMNNSVTLLSRSLSSKEKAAEPEAQRKAATEITNPEEKKAKLTEVQKSETASLSRSDG